MSLHRVALESWESLFKAHISMMKHLESDSIWQQEDLSIKEYAMLSDLAQSDTGTLRIQELHETVLLSQPSVSRMVHRLSERLLVSKAFDPEDRRGTLVSITSQGRTVQQRIWKQYLEQVAGAMLKVLEQEELEALLQLSSKLHRIHEI